MKTNSSMLGGLTTEEFLRDYWQKKPLLIRQAFSQFNGLLDQSQLFALACTEDVQSRLVTQRHGQWQVQDGPFKATKFDSLRKSKWTVLVQGVNQHLQTAAALLKNFSFIPHARLDDLMVSYAPKGGGVGAHFDSYDVFLLQGSGHRRWQISAQQDHTLVEGAPLRILQRFQMEQEWVLAPGDMLYLPPHYAHNGIAESDCMTYSIGFRTPTHQELAEQFLVYMQDRVCLDGMYADPDLKLQRHPSEIGTDMLRQVVQIIRRIKWTKRDIANFLGSYLSDPKPHIFFDPPTNPLSRARFEQVIQTCGVAMALKTQMLCHNGVVFINGMAHTVGKYAYRELRSLADARQLDSTVGLSREAVELLYLWYTDGYIVPIASKHIDK
ncbi:cupin domain-containing protein [Candidatus Nitrotoga sp. 1052]|uniref:cupin domain-containing protein n=1 Tax=Candidatus Nitrotoga sp. 1052 TaxID=2886964 RepID=UPI001EF61601|nr:cupin domain-containing protein [Candidatus Nitrotoga sp. 1052]CAH1071560.1 JmjC domain-containing protein [Candidatus Nitrotoga sp. 1052]